MGKGSPSEGTRDMKKSQQSRWNNYYMNKALHDDNFARALVKYYESIKDKECDKCHHIIGN